MLSRVTGNAFTVAALTIAGIMPAWSASLPESWYMSRGKANLEIANYKAAIEAFEKVVEMDPDNLEARRDLGLAYDAQGLKDKAVDQFDKYLEKRPDDPEIALRQAQILSWARYAYRRNDAIKYYREGLRRKDNVEARLNFADMLANEKDTAPEAIQQYKLVLKRLPNSARAYRGLAKAYAWLGNQDQALYFAELARSNRSADASVSALEADLMKGREPEVRGTVGIVSQSGEKESGYDGYRFGVGGKRDISPFATLNFDAGLEAYRRSQIETDGIFYAISLDYRPDQDRKLRGRLGGYSGRPASNTGTPNRSSDTVGGVEYVEKGSAGYKAYGFERDRKSDSLRALTGEVYNGRTYGRALTNAFYARFVKDGTESGWQLKAYAGWVSAMSASDNAVVGADVYFEMPVIKTERYMVAFVNDLRVAHYAQDQFDFTDRGGGYFSPQVFLDESPQFSVKWRLEDGRDLEISGGPAPQYVRDQSSPGKWSIGGSLHAHYLGHIKRRLYWTLGADYDRVANVYAHFAAETTVIYKY